MNLTGRPWFVPKSHGYGATPVTWQGWAVTIAFVAAGGLCGWFLLSGIGESSRPILRIALFFAATAVLVIGLIAVSRARTDGEWRWRWGDADRQG